MTIGAIIVLVIIGLIFLILEILIIPGGIVGIIGALMMVLGVWGGYHYHGILFGNLILLGVLLINALAIYFSLKSKTWDRLMLKKNIEGRSGVNQNVADELLIGNVGKTLSRLMPMGKAEFNNKSYEVTAFEGSIDANEEIVIVLIKDSKIFVNKTK